MTSRNLKWFRLPASLVVLSSVALAMTAQPVKAAAPDAQKVSFTEVRVDDFLSGVCGFPVTRVTVHNITTFTYADGTQKVVLTGQNYDVFSGPGGSLRATDSGMDRYTVNPDGTITDVSSGNFGMVVVPGSGPVLLGAGRVVTVYDPSTNQIVSRTTTGNFRTADFTTFCGALAG